MSDVKLTNIPSMTVGKMVNKLSRNREFGYESSKGCAQ